jgi:hypothetical protein
MHISIEYNIAEQQNENNNNLSSIFQEFSITIGVVNGRCQPNNHHPKIWQMML